MMKQYRNGVVIFWFGVLLLILSLFFFVRRLLRLRRCTSFATGTLVNAERFGNTSSVRLTVRFSAGDETVTCTDKQAAGAAYQKRVGEELDIRYNPDNPSDFLVEDNHSEQRAILICLVSGLLFFLVGEVMAGPLGANLPFSRELSFIWWYVRYRLIKAWGR